MFNPKLQECYMVNEDNATIFAGAGDDEKEEEPTSGNMEKLEETACGIGCNLDSQEDR